MMKTIIAHQQSAIPSLGEDVPAELDAVHKQMVAKNPDDRFQSMAVVADALDALDIEDEPTDVTPQAAPGSKAMLETKTLVDTSRDVIDAPPSTAPPITPWKRIAACLLGLVGLVWAAGIFIKVETSEGTIILEINQSEMAGAVVSVDGKNKITIKTGEGKEPIEIVADEKMHTLRVTKGGWQADNQGTAGANEETCPRQYSNYGETGCGMGVGDRRNH